MNITDKHAQDLDNEMLSEAEDTLSELEIMISNMESGVEETENGLKAISNHARRIKSYGFSADHPLIDLLLHRLINYAEAIQNLTDDRYADLNTFTDVLRGLLEGRIPSNSDQSEFIRSLPVSRPVDVSDLESLNIEIMLVEPQKISARIFERELQSGGYRVMLCHRSFEAFELAVRTKPDAIICSYVLDEISGVDLARALAAVPATEKVPFSILTSYERNSPKLSLLPENAGYIRKDENFGDDLANVLESFGLT